MTDTLIVYKNPHEIGAALAAPQVGEAVAMTVIRKDFSVDLTKMKEPKRNFFTIVNPEIVESSKDKIEDMEGCLSIPGTYGTVKRAKEVTVKGVDLSGRGVTIKAKDFMARVLQHEIDHLHGILFTDRIEEVKKLYRLTKEGQLLPQKQEEESKNQE